MIPRAARINGPGAMFGALAASPAGVVKGRGVPLSQLTFGLLIFPGVWVWYLQWREQRRGFYTKWEEDMLMVAQALTRSEVGWIRQHPELLKNVRLIEGLGQPDRSQASSARADAVAAASARLSSLALRWSSRLQTL